MGKSSACAMALALLVASRGCTCVVAATITCGEDADCPSGYRCDPAAGLCLTRDDAMPDGGVEMTGADRAGSDAAVSDRLASESALSERDRADSWREDAAGPEASLDTLPHDVQTSEAGARDAVALDRTLTDATATDAAALDLAMSDGARPDALPHDVTIPDVALPDISAPDIAAPDTAAPDTGVPDIATTDTGAPDGWQPSDHRCVARDCSLCGGLPCYPHPQDAVNDAVPGDTIVVYPGWYGPRYYDTRPPHYSDNDKWAPPLIVYREGLTIVAADTNPGNTVLYNDLGFWHNPVAIQASTGGTWDSDSGVYVGAGVDPIGGTSPAALLVIANDVTIRGFYIYNTSQWAAVLIGALCRGCAQFVGISGTHLADCDVSGHIGIDIWKAADTVVRSCSVDNNAITPEPHGPPVNVWDGQNQLPYVTSRGTQIVDNTITAVGECGDEGGCRGISLGGYQNGPVDHSDLYIDGNTVTATGHGLLLWNSSGKNKVMTCDNQVSAGNGYQRLVLLESTFDGPFPCD